MKIDEIEIDATLIKFFDDYIIEENAEVVKKDFDMAVVNVIKKLIDTENL